MLQATLQEINASRYAPERVAQRWWGPLLQVEFGKRQELCNDIAQYFNARKAADVPQDASSSADARPRITIAEAFLDVYCAALYAIHTNLAAPLAWHSAAVSRLRRGPTSPSATDPAAALTFVQLCDSVLLHSRGADHERFSCLLLDTGMGVPLLSLVLDAYGYAVVNVLSCQNQQGAQVDVEGCLKRLHHAADCFTLGGGPTPELTIVHPILLHCLRVSGRTLRARELLKSPVRAVNPFLTGVGLADYVAYYAEAALVLAEDGDYTAAFYALTPLHSLPEQRGLSEQSRGRSHGAWVGELTRAEAYFASFKAPRAERQQQSSTPALHAPSTTAAAATARPTTSVVEASLAWYPWYRPRPITTPQTSFHADYRGDRISEDVVEWHNFLIPSAAELRRDQQLRAWALRLSLLLLSLAFGGGNVRAVQHANPDHKHFHEYELDWRGMDTASVIRGHLCFSSLLFEHLSRSTRVSLAALLAAAAKNFSPEMQVYYDLLLAVVQRDGVAARAALIGPSSSAALFTADLTLPLVNALVNSYLARHILLDVARLYSRVPLRFLMDRTRQAMAHVRASAATTATLEEEEGTCARGVLRVLAELCASGELQCCTVGATAVESVVAVDGFAATSIDVDDTAVSLVLPSDAQVIQQCARIASRLLYLGEGGLWGEGAPGTSTTSLLQMLTQLQALQHAVETESGAVKALS